MNADQKLESFESMMSEISGALADMVSVMQEKSENDALDAISGSLADIVSAMEKRSSAPMGELIAAIKALRLAIPVVNLSHTIQVHPTPIKLLPAPVHIMPAKGCDYEVVPRYDLNGAIVKMTITRIKSND